MEQRSFQKTMGTLPVFMTAISTILGAILYLRFGYAVGHTGLVGTILIVVLGHVVTVATAMAVAEIATNKKVEGGGAYFMISRSFGLNFGAAIGIALYLSQAISVAFYIIAFAFSFEPVALWIGDHYGVYLSHQDTGLIMMTLLLLLMLTKGADIGVKALYIVVALIVSSLVLFFLGGEYSQPATSFVETVENPDSFFKVFTIIFPAFTGIAAGLGLSGDLKDPKKSIPQGTLWATLVGFIVYIAMAFKLHYSASAVDLANTDWLIMEQISVWGPIVPIGLAAATMSSALGSIMIAPRTLQALGADEIFPSKVNEIVAKGRAKDNEPIQSIIITGVIGYAFILGGDIDAVAEVISMFFMVTYGAICSISFFEHFGGSPSYRPTFRSKWYLSLLGAVLCFYLMFMMNFTYAVGALLIMGAIYFGVKHTKKDHRGLVELVKGVVFQLNREFQIFLQKRDSPMAEDQWRPFVLTISDRTFITDQALMLTSWIGSRYGFGTYIHFIEGFLSRETYLEALKIKDEIARGSEHNQGKVFVDTIVSPSFTSAIAQSIQLSGVSGKDNNMVLFEYPQSEPQQLERYISNYPLLRSTNFDVGILRTGGRQFGEKKSIDIWVSGGNSPNGNTMILLAFVMMGHRDWAKAEIRILSIYEEGKKEEKRIELEGLVQAGRLPISVRNIVLIPKGNKEFKEVINEQSKGASLTMLGFAPINLQGNWHPWFEGYEHLGNVLFVNAFSEKEIE